MCVCCCISPCWHRPEIGAEPRVACSAVRRGRLRCDQRCDHDAGSRLLLLRTAHLPPPLCTSQCICVRVCVCSVQLSCDSVAAVRGDSGTFSVRWRWRSLRVLRVSMFELTALSLSLPLPPTAHRRQHTRGAGAEQPRSIVTLPCACRWDANAAPRRPTSSRWRRRPTLTYACSCSTRQRHRSCNTCTWPRRHSRTRIPMPACRRIRSTLASSRPMQPQPQPWQSTTTNRRRSASQHRQQRRRQCQQWHQFKRRHSPCTDVTPLHWRWGRMQPLLNQREPRRHPQLHDADGQWHRWCWAALGAATAEGAAAAVGRHGAQKLRREYSAPSRWGRRSR